MSRSVIRRRLMRPYKATLDLLRLVDWTSAYLQPYWPGLRFLAGHTAAEEARLYTEQGNWPVAEGALRAALNRLPKGQFVEASLNGGSEDDLADMSRWSRCFGRVLVYDLAHVDSFEKRYLLVRSWAQEHGDLGFVAVETIKLRSPYQLGAARVHLRKCGYRNGSLLRYGRGGYSWGVKTKRLLRLPPVHEQWFAVVDVKDGPCNRWYLICDSGKGDYFELVADGPLSADDARGEALVALTGWRRTEDGWIPKNPVLLERRTF